MQDSTETASNIGSLNNVGESSDSEENTDSEQGSTSDRGKNTREVVHPTMTQTETDHNVCGNSVSSAGVKLKTGQTVTSIKPDDGHLQRAKVLDRAGKASGRHKNWFYLQHVEPDGSDRQKESVDTV